MRIIEKEMFSYFVGKKVNEDRFSELFKEYWSNGYVTNCCKLHPRFGITDRLFGAWECDAIEYRVYVFLNDGTVEKGFTNKEREGCCGHGRPVAHMLTPTQQELRVARRILEYITE